MEINGLHSEGSVCNRRCKNRRCKNEGNIYYALSRELGKAFEAGSCGKTGAMKNFQKKNELRYREGVCVTELEPHL